MHIREIYVQIFLLPCWGREPGAGGQVVGCREFAGPLAHRQLADRHARQAAKIPERLEKIFLFPVCWVLSPFLLCLRLLSFLLCYSSVEKKKLQKPEHKNKS